MKPQQIRVGNNKKTFLDVHMGRIKSSMQSPEAMATFWSREARLVLGVKICLKGFSWQSYYEQ